MKNFPEAPMAQPTGPPKTVVLAARDPAVRERFSAALRGAGHRAIETETRSELLATLRQATQPADLIVLDLALGVEGAGLVRSVRELEADAPLVVLSGTVEKAATIRELSELGIDSFVNEHCPVHHILPSLAPRLFPDSFDRRTSTRVKLDLPVAYRFADTIATAPTLNLSKGGVAVRTMSPPHVGTKVHVRFRLPGSQGDLEAGSRVAWSDHRAGMGLQFEEVEVTDQSAIDEFVDQQAFEGRPSP